MKKELQNVPNFFIVKYIFTLKTHLKGKPQNFPFSEPNGSENGLTQVFLFPNFIFQLKYLYFVPLIIIKIRF